MYVLDCGAGPRDAGGRSLARRAAGAVPTKGVLEHAPGWGAAGGFECVCWGWGRGRAGRAHRGGNTVSVSPLRGLAASPPNGFIVSRVGVDMSLILPQVHLRKPCYDFSFL